MKKKLVSHVRETSAQATYSNFQDKFVAAILNLNSIQNLRKVVCVEPQIYNGTDDLHDRSLLASRSALLTMRPCGGSLGEEFTWWILPTA